MKTISERLKAAIYHRERVFHENAGIKEYWSTTVDQLESLLNEAVDIYVSLSPHPVEPSMVESGKEKEWICIKCNVVFPSNRLRPLTQIVNCPDDKCGGVATIYPKIYNDGVLEGRRQERSASHLVPLLNADVEDVEKLAKRYDEIREKVYREIIPEGTWSGSPEYLLDLLKKVAVETMRRLLFELQSPLPEELAGEEKERPKIVCLCGSTRFWKTFQDASLKETLNGKIVLSIGSAKSADGDDKSFGGYSPINEFDEIKKRLDELHKRKIDLADEVLILNVYGYLGESTLSELEYARDHGKQIRWFETDISGRAQLGDVLG